MRRFGLILAFLLAASSAAAQQPDVDGLDAFARNDFAAARPLLETPAAAGEPRAQGALGLILLDGLAGERDPARAEQLCTASAAAGAALGQRCLARILMRRGGDADRVQAIELLRRAAAPGDVAAEGDLAVALLAAGNPADVDD